MTNASAKLLPFLEKAKSNHIQSTAEGSSYLEMKYNLMMAYCQFLSFFMLLKADGCPNIEKHPVVKRLLYVKTMFEKLKPLDQKL